MKPSTAERASLRRKIVLAVAALVIGLLGLELAVRVRQRIKYGTFGQIQEFATDPKTGLIGLIPGRDTGAIRVNSLGFRGPEIEQPKPPGRIRIAFCGGSTTYCAEASGNDAVWPAKVCAELARKFPGKQFDYVNAGVPGYTLEQIALSLQQKVAPLEPDVIVLYEATNDLTHDTRELAQEQGVYTGHGDDESWISRTSLAWFLIEKQLAMHSRSEAAKTDVGRVTFEPRELSVHFRDRVSEFVALAKSRAKFVTLTTFCYRGRRTQSTGEQLEACKNSLFYMPYMTPALLLDGFDEYNRVIREVARATQTNCIECADAVPGDGIHFADSVHFTDAGCDAMAVRIVEGLSSAPAFAALCAP